MKNIRASVGFALIGVMVFGIGLVVNRSALSLVSSTDQLALVANVAPVGNGTAVLSGIVSNGATLLDITPRIAYWYGKVDQHVDAQGNWQTDPDGSSGANIDMLTYCKKWYPNTGSVAPYKIESITTWHNGGNTGLYTASVMSYRCIPADTTPRIAYWTGKVDQHVDAQGNWVTDPDGISGSTIDKLTYCKKWYPNTTAVKDYKLEPIATWRDRGNTGGPYTAPTTSTQCVQLAPPVACSIDSFTVPSNIDPASPLPDGPKVSWNISNCALMGRVVNYNSYTSTMEGAVEPERNNVAIGAPVFPSYDPTYEITLYASDADGKHAVFQNKAIPVKTTPPAGMPVCTVSSVTGPDSVVKGGTLTLKWSSSNCQNISILRYTAIPYLSKGNPLTTLSPTAAGTLTVSQDADTVYTVVGTGYDPKHETDNARYTTSQKSILVKVQ